MSKYMTLVFDDGPRDPMCEMIDLFKSYGFTCGFAIIGNQINDETESMLRYAVENGCALASHSQTHAHLEKLSSRREIEEELTAPIKEVKRRIGYEITMARLPYISYNDEVLSVCKELGLPLLGQGIDGGRDWSGDSDPETVANAVISTAADGAVGCLHVRNNTFEALKKIIPQLKKEGYILLSPDEFFKVKCKGKIPTAVNINILE